MGEQRGCGRALLDLKWSWESAAGFGGVVGERCWIWKGRGRAGSWETATGFGWVVCRTVSHDFRMKIFSLLI